MSENYIVTGNNQTSPITLKLYRGDGMCLLGMNWREGEPPDHFVGFAIEYKAPDSDRFYSLTNRLTFEGADTDANYWLKYSKYSPIQKFRWVHFPYNAEQSGDYTYRVTPVFMDEQDHLQYGETQEASIELNRETYPDKLNITYTRGFVSSQAFVDFYESEGAISTLLPANSEEGLTFLPTHPKKVEAYRWMGFEARSAILEVLDKAIADQEAIVRVVAYDINEPEVVSKLEQLGSRLKIIIDDSAGHADETSCETLTTQRLQTSAGQSNVKRQHMGNLQHNKTIVVSSPSNHIVICGSTNFTWRGLYVQNNNAMVIYGETAATVFLEAFDNYWNLSVNKFKKSNSAVRWIDLGLENINAKATFSPHSPSNVLLDEIATDITTTESSFFFALAFLYQTKGTLRENITNLFSNENIFVYGISDKKLHGLDLQKPSGNIAPVYPMVLGENLPAPFSKEPSGGGGIRLHHKFIVIDFDKADKARVYLGSYNFSKTANNYNGENLLLIQNQQVAVSYMIEAVTIIDHYHFRVAQAEASKARKSLYLAKPPRNAGEVPWWKEDYVVEYKIRDRELFA
jgi:hypothetical protein